MIRISRPLMIILAIAALLRFGFAFGRPLLEFPDTHSYFEAGRSLWETGLMSINQAMPLYGLLAYLAGGGYVLVVIDILFSLGTVWLMYLLSRELFRIEVTALLTAACAAIYPHFIFFSAARLSESSFIFLLCLSFLLLYRGRFFWAALVIAISILERPSIDLLAPLLMIYFARWVHHHTWQRTGKELAMYVLVYLVVLTPWWIHNYVKYDQFVRLSLADGVVLYAGHNPMNESGGGIMGEDVDYSQFDGISDPVDKNQAMKSEALKFMREHPEKSLYLAGLKFIRFWRLWPRTPSFNTPLYIAISLLSYGVMLGLALMFVLRYARKHLTGVAPLFILAAYFTGIHMVLIGSIRYRLPLEPFILILGAYSLHRLMEGAGLFNWLSRFELASDTPTQSSTQMGR